ncbi:Protein of unknown function DUF2225 [Desulfotomaculum nigrificans CO-1-SRB]|uniref:DUF2225 domain-containing protein n=1 Tax=Desulfotomaculum nigrificans (strain DSM 14880 / VKM B-2319 / CO-1-SRB) TaxID=868595 RepID=F6B7J8_DESCC|nr:DUF2225 domain-containing protein [Desulfotomaculum nigrificans]AEF94552.1 Protein of unknown function DUF2225 [Desulfotomaculum nigrificans CO-1-SRB]
MQVTEEMIFPVQYTCPHCGKQFSHPEVKSKYIIMERQDSDFCSYYAAINPIYYDVLVCRFCGYSYTKETNVPLTDQEKAAIGAILANWHTEGYQYGGLRTLEQAINAYNLAILCQELRNAKDSVKGSLFLRLAWLYRYQGNKEKETVCLQRALEFMIRAYERESGSELKKELRMMYIMGDLAYRLGDIKEAIKWFQAVTNHPGAARYPVYSRMARSRWQDLRQELKK